MRAVKDHLTAPSAKRWKMGRRRRALRRISLDGRSEDQHGRRSTGGWKYERKELSLRPRMGPSHDARSEGLLELFREQVIEEQLVVSQGLPNIFRMRFDDVH